VEVTVYRDGESAFAALAGEWNGLVETSAANTVFATWDWQQAWWERWGSEYQAQIVAIRDEGHLVGLAPLMGLELAGRPALRLIGGTEVADYLDCVIARGWESKVLPALIEALGPAWQLLDLHGLPAASPNRPLLHQLAQNRGWSVTETVEDRCPVTQLADTWDDYLNSLDKKDRHELRRKLRRLEGADVGARYVRVTDPAALPAAVHDFARLHRLASGNKASFMDEPMEQFFLHLARAMFARGWLDLSFLEVEGRRVASNYAFTYGDTVYLYNSGYDPAYSSLSVGVLVVAYGIQAAIAQGKHLYDFLQGDEPYKYDFGAKDTLVYNLVIQRTASS